MFTPWWEFSTDAVMLAVEAQSVIAMRLTSIALGRGTHASATTRMVSEKATAFAEAAMTLATGGSAHEVVRGYRKHVRANGRRLRRCVHSSPDAIAEAVAAYAARGCGQEPASKAPAAGPTLSIEPSIDRGRDRERLRGGLSGCGSLHPRDLAGVCEHLLRTLRSLSIGTMCETC